MTSTTGVSTATTTALAAARKAGINSSTGQVTSVASPAGLSTANAVAPYLTPYVDQITSIQKEETSNTSLVNAYQTMQGLLTNLETASSMLESGYSSSTNAYNNRTTTLSSTGSLTATAAEGTPTGSYTIDVSQLATAASYGGAPQPSESAALGYSGTFNIGAAGNTASTVTVTAGETLQDIANAINYNSSTNGVTATLLTVTAGSDYRLVITANNTDEAITTTPSSNGLLTSLGLSNMGSASLPQPHSILSTPQPALLTVDGIAVTRTSNEISDVISGVTMNLTATTASPVTLTVAYNTSSVFTAVNTFKTAYNQWRAFVNSNEATASDGTAGSSAVLWGDSTLRTVSVQIDSALSKIVDNNSLSGIGLSLNGSNQLELNSTTLSTTLTNNFSAVELLFGGNSLLSETGIAQSIYNTSFEYGDTSIGYVQRLVEGLQSQNNTYASQVSALQQQASTYETFLLQQYGQLTSFITANNNEASLLQALDATNSSN